MSEPRYKAASLVTVRQWLRDRGLDERFRASLEPAVVERYDRLLATEWVEVSIADAIYAAAAPLLHPDEPLAVRRLGRELAHDHLRGIYRFLFRFMTVEFAVQQTARLWRMYNDTGTLSVVESRPQSLRAVLTGYPGYPAAVRESLAGYLVGGIELTGAKGVRVSVTETGTDATFHVTWR
jgi:hypothetical protein